MLLHHPSSTPVPPLHWSCFAVVGIPHLFTGEENKHKAHQFDIAKIIPADQAGMVALANQLQPFGATLDSFCKEAAASVKAAAMAGMAASIATGSGQQEADDFTTQEQQRQQAGTQPSPPSSERTHSMG